LAAPLYSSGCPVLASRSTNKEEKLMDVGPTELLLILGIVILLFGVGRIGKIAGELGSGIRAFKEGLNGKSEEEGQTSNNPPKTE
jgi:sec-independent protein translocase protein TatA